MAVAGANRNDMKLVRATIESIVVPRPEPTPEHPQGMCLDKGYDYDETRDLVREFDASLPDVPVDFSISPRMNSCVYSASGTAVSMV